MRIAVYRFGIISLFVGLKAGSIKNIMIKDCLYISGLMKLLFSGHN
jgi:hypothetical protein